MLLGATVFWSLVVYLLLGHGSLPRRFRRAAPFVALAAALVAFAAAPFVEGRYVREVYLFIAGPNAYSVESVERSYTGLALGLGAVALALAALARGGGRLVGERVFARAVALTLGVIGLRVALEKLGAPLQLATFVGIIWLAVPLGVAFGVEAARLGSARRFWALLFGYAWGIRLIVIAVMLVVTRFELGTHFDNSGITRFDVLGREIEVAAHSWDQYWSLIFFPQLAHWPTLTVLLGTLSGGAGYLIARRRLAAATPEPGGAAA